ncbi:MAG: cation:proton antiporter [Candidatus Methanoplasma sp.]|nr:cation:proton antiporter [Candidatus Methanoplasma sp.]
MTILLLVAGICSVIFKRLKMPPIIGYLAAGIILASYWTMNDDTEDIIEFLANVGLVLLMFCIGMELNLEKMRKTGAFAIMVVLIQIPTMIIGGYIFGALMGWDPIQSLFFGAIISGSSTAVVTTVLKSQGRLSKDDIETIVLITVVEDVAQVLILSMASPMLGGQSLDMMSIITMLVIIIIFMAASVAFGILAIPRLLDWIDDKMPNEVLMIMSMGLCFAMSWVSVMIGMSMAIGAFLMGVIVSQSRSRQKIEHDVTPMKDIFMAMFFISVGLQISPRGIMDNIFLIIMIFVIYAVLKAGSVIVAYFVGNKSLRLSFMSSVSLVAMGEFSFIIAKEAMDAGIVSDAFYTSVIGAALVSMVMLPLLSGNSGKICDFLYTRAPRPVVSAVGAVEAIREKQYNRLGLTSKSNVAKMKAKAIQVYVDIFILAGMEMVFVLFSEDISDTIYESITILNHLETYLIVLAINFAALLMPLYNLVNSIIFLEKSIINAERVATRHGEGDLQRATIRFFRAFIRVKIWPLILTLDFAILAVIPNYFGFWGYIMPAIAAIAALAVTVRFYKLTKKP